MTLLFGTINTGSSQLAWDDLLIASHCDFLLFQEPPGSKGRDASVTKRSFIKGYEVHSGRRAGIAVKNHLAKRCTVLKKEPDFVIIRYGVGDTSFIIISYYQEQNLIASECLNSLETTLTNFSNSKIIIGGDWNASKREWIANSSAPGGELHSRGAALERFAAAHGFSISQPSGPTRINHCLDFFISRGIPINNLRREDVVKTDHKMVTGVINDPQQISFMGMGNFGKFIVIVHGFLNS